MSAGVECPLWYVNGCLCYGPDTPTKCISKAVAKCYTLLAGYITQTEEHCKPGGGLFLGVVKKHRWKCRKSLSEVTPGMLFLELE